MWKKIGFGILFVASCFAAMYTLIKFNGNIVYVSASAALLLITAFLFLKAIFSEKVKKWTPEQNKEEEFVFSGTGEELSLEFSKYMKETASIQKELLEVIKNQNTLLQSEINNLEHEIYLLSEKQVNQAKSIIKFNKENARQLAINERETLEYVMTELKKAIEKKTSRVAEDFAEEAFAEEAFAEEEVLEVPEDFDLAALLDREEETESVPEAEAESLPEEEPLAGVSSDPNAMMTPEDIAKLLEAMGQ